MAKKSTEEKQPTDQNERPVVVTPEPIAHVNRPSSEVSKTSSNTKLYIIMFVAVILSAVGGLLGGIQIGKASVLSSRVHQKGSLPAMQAPPEFNKQQVQPESNQSTEQNQTQRPQRRNRTSANPDSETSNTSAEINTQLNSQFLPVLSKSGENFIKNNYSKS